MLDKNHNLYIVKVHNGSGEELIKIGYSANINKRLYSYYTHNPLIELVGTLYHEDAVRLEKEIHSSFKSSCLNEWYSTETFQNILKFLETREVKISTKEDTKYLKLSLEVQKNLLDLLNESEYFILMKLVSMVDYKTNRLLGYNSNLSANMIAKGFGNIAKRKIIKNVIKRFFDLNILKEDYIGWVLNPDIAYYSNNLPKSTLDLFK